MKVRITGIPVRINGKRYYKGTELDVDDEVYQSIKSNCIVVGLDDEVDTVVEIEDDIETENLTEDDIIRDSKEYKDVSKDDIMIKLAGMGVEFDPNISKLKLFKMLGSD